MLRWACGRSVSLLLNPTSFVGSCFRGLWCRGVWLRSVCNPIVASLVCEHLHQYCWLLGTCIGVSWLIHGWPCRFWFEFVLCLFGPAVIIVFGGGPCCTYTLYSPGIMQRLVNNRAPSRLPCRAGGLTPRDWVPSSGTCECWPGARRRWTPPPTFPRGSPWRHTPRRRSRRWCTA